MIIRALLLAGCMACTSFAQAASVMVAAAADLRFALTDITAQFEQAHPDVDIELVFASSGKLFSQIVEGAPYHLFLSADIGYPQRLFDDGRAMQPPVPYARGQLVMWSTRHDICALQLDDLTQSRFRRIAIAQPLHAPYGRLARDVLMHHKLWQPLEPQLVYADNVAHAAQLVASGAADVGLVARSVAQQHDGYVATIDTSGVAPLVQGYVITTHGAQNLAATKKFIHWLHSRHATQVLSDYGFVPLAGAP